MSFLLLLFALPPEHVAVHDGARLIWRENICAGFKAGDDCSVRQPGTAEVRVELADRTVRIWVRCRAKGCEADQAEVAEWVERARGAK